MSKIFFHVENVNHQASLLCRLLVMKRRHKTFLFVLVLSLFYSISSVAQSIQTFSAPEGAELSNDFEVCVKSDNSSSVWQSLSVFGIKVDEVINGKHHNETASVATFCLDDGASVQVRIVSRRQKVDAVRVRPASRGVEPVVSGDTITFTINCPQDLSVEVNGDLYHNLHVLANPVYRNIKSKSKKKNNTIVFGPGYHVLPGGVMDVQSGQTIYIDGGAWVEGGFRVKDASDVHIYGAGVVRPKVRGYGVEIANSSNVCVEGIITTQVPVGGSHDVVIRRVKCFTNYGWGDGLNIFASHHVVQEDCFARTSDDCMTVYATRMGYVGGAHDIIVRRMTLWADVAHPIFVGLHGAAAYKADNKSRRLPLLPDADQIVTRNDTIRDILFEDIDILEQNEKQVDYQGCLSIVSGDNNVVRDVTFRDIRIDRIRQGALLAIRVFENEKYCKAPGKGIENILFENITFAGGGELSVIEGFNTERMVQDITFRNLVVDGQSISDTMPGKPSWYKTTDMCRMLVGSFVKNLKFE